MLDIRLPNIAKLREILFLVLHHRKSFLFFIQDVTPELSAFFQNESFNFFSLNFPPTFQLSESLGLLERKKLKKKT